MFTEEQKQKYYSLKAIMELNDTSGVDVVIDFVNASKTVDKSLSYQIVQILSFLLKTWSGILILP
jgi:hypothetical protein